MKGKNKVSYSMIFIVFLIFAVAMIFVTILITNKMTDTRNYFKKYNNFINNSLSDQLKYQSEVDRKLEDIFNNGNYTLNKPYLLQNPYNLNPLSAIVIFNTLKKESVTLSINGEEVGKDTESFVHIIPVVGLLSDSLNIITLTSDGGEKTDLEIRTNIYDDNFYDLNVNNSLKDKNNSLMLLGDLKTGKSTLRGINSIEKLNFVLDFDYIKGIGKANNHLYIKYNSKRTTSVPDIKLEMDYLGRIYSISSNTVDINGNPNLILNDDKESLQYIIFEDSYYNNKIIDKYNFVSVVDKMDYTDYEAIETATIIKKLDEAKTYNKDFDISLMGNYVGVDLKGAKANILIINKYNNYTYKYEINGFKLLKIDMPDDVSLYAQINGEYYTLLTVLEN